MRKILLVTLLLGTMSLFPIITALDGDGDGIDDNLDICPFASGTANSTAGMGCPDSDGNGLANFEQATYHDWSDSGYLDVDRTSMSPNVNAVTWARNDSVFYAGSHNNEVRVFDSSGNNLALLHTMQGDVFDIEISPSGDNLIVASENAGCKIINATTGMLVNDLMSSLTVTSGIFEAAWSNDNSRVFCGGFGGILHSFYTSNWSLERNYSEFPYGWISGIDTTPDGRVVFLSSNTDVYGYWTSNGTLYHSLTNHSGYVRVLTISPDGRYLATGSQDTTLLVTDIKTKTVVANISMGAWIHDIDFSSDGGSMLVSRGFRDSFFVYRTDTWTSIGEITGFGTEEDNRGVFSAEFDSSGENMAVGWRRGWVSVQTIGENLITVQGQNYTVRMEESWRSTYTATDHKINVKEIDRLQSTIDACDSKARIGSSSNGIHPLYTTKVANYSTSGLLDCDNTDEQILEIPYGIAPGAMMVKSGGYTETCIQNIGALSMGQLRWIVSASTRNGLTSNGEIPGINWNSVIPNDDGDGVREWIDLDPSCPDEEIILVHRSTEMEDLSIIQQTLLCLDCSQPDSLYPSTDTRIRLDVGVNRSDVIDMITTPEADGWIAFTEMVYTLDNSNGVYVIPLIDNYTHGAADAIADSGTIVNASINASRDGEWPLQTYMRAFTPLSSITKNIEFLKHLLSDIGQFKWQQSGFVGLGYWDLYTTWAKLGVDAYSILPDADSDGVWDGDDLCPNSSQDYSVDLQGCSENQLDDDNDGITNDLDDCDDDYGTSFYVTIGCPDADGDGWPDSDDTHPNDVTEWNDTDMDGFGDNSDDCIESSGNSTYGSIGCTDTDGDGWADINDSFIDDSSEWLDSDSDGYGDNTDAFPYEITQWIDSDSDGFGDNNSGLEGDDCIDISGSSNKEGIFGCLDSDGDGWADSIDDLPTNPEQYRDVDGDGVGDSVSSSNFDMCPETASNEISMVDEIGCGPSERDGDYDTFTDDIDQCPNTPLMLSTFVNTTQYLDQAETIPNPVLGCALAEIDLDGDLVTADLDWDDNNPNQSADSDGDGFGDNVESDDGDDCPQQKGTSFRDQNGCLDIDGDGWSYQSDFNDGDPTQWNDTDGDGFGDNWNNPEWSEGRIIGEFVEGATEPDRCPSEYTPLLYSDTEGCLIAENKNDEADNQAKKTDDTEEASNLVIILGIAGVGIILILFGSIAILLKRNNSSKNTLIENLDIAPVHPALERGQAQQKQAVKKDDKTNNSISSNVKNFVENWEDLPDGDWLPNDENGVHWYEDKMGRYWYSTEDGYRIWEE